MRRVMLMIMLMALLMLTACDNKKNRLIYDENDKSTWWYEANTSDTRDTGAGKIFTEDCSG